MFTTIGRYRDPESVPRHLAAGCLLASGLGCTGACGGAVWLGVELWNLLVQLVAILLALLNAPRPLWLAEIDLAEVPPPEVLAVDLAPMEPLPYAPDPTDIPTEGLAPPVWPPPPPPRAREQAVELAILRESAGILGLLGTTSELSTISSVWGDGGTFGSTFGGIEGGLIGAEGVGLAGGLGSGTLGSRGAGGGGSAAGIGGLGRLHSAGDREARVVRRVPVEAPPGATGRCRARVTLGADDAVRAVEILDCAEGAGPAVEDALRRFGYQTRRSAGAPVEASLVVVVELDG